MTVSLTLVDRGGSRASVQSALGRSLTIFQNYIFNLYLEHSSGESALYTNVGYICTARFVKIVSSAIFKTLNGNVSYPQYDTDASKLNKIPCRKGTIL